MDAHLFRLFTNRLEPLLTGARLEKIREPFPDLLALDFYAAGKKRHLYLKFSRKEPFCFLGDITLNVGAHPSARIMRVRRYFGGCRIAAVVTRFRARRLWLLAANPEKKTEKAVWLCLDLANGFSLHFLDADQSPEAENPGWPEAGELDKALVDWREWPVLTPPLRQSLAKMEKADQLALMEDLRSANGDLFLYKKMGEDGKPEITKALAWPLPDQLRGDLEEEQREDILEALEEAGRQFVVARIFQKQAETRLAPVKRRIKNLRKLLEKLDTEEKRLLAMRGREPDALALAANFWRLPAESHLSAITVPEEGVDREIGLDKRYSLRENMERFFHIVRRGKRGLAMLAERREKLRAELTALESMEKPLTKDSAFSALQTAYAREEANSRPRPAHATALRGILPRNVALYVSSDGYILLRGKDARGNHAMRGFASPHDLWTHVEQGPGSHVIIRRAHPGEEVPERTLEEAGTLAVSRSWLCGSDSGSVMYAEMRHVKPARKGPAGKMIIDRILMTRVAPVNPELEKKLVVE